MHHPLKLGYFHREGRSGSSTTTQLWNLIKGVQIDSKNWVNSNWSYNSRRFLRNLSKWTLNLNWFQWCKRQGIEINWISVQAIRLWINSNHSVSANVHLCLSNIHQMLIPPTAYRGINVLYYISFIHVWVLRMQDVECRLCFVYSQCSFISCLICTQRMQWFLLNTKMSIETVFILAQRACDQQACKVILERCWAYSEDKVSINS